MVSGISNATQLALGAGHSCALTNAGAVYCWGRNNSGELGHDPATDMADASGVTYATAPRQVTLPSAAVRIAAGYSHTCALLQDGTVRCWGANNAGQLGPQADAGTYAPKQVTGL
jgi:alpha-tubulin suppressor-like RCC1 family protein